MTFQADEQSVEDSQPRECYEIILPMVTYRIARGRENVVLDGQTYTASGIDREEQSTDSITEQKDLTILLSASHAFPQRWNRGGVPPRRVIVNAYRKQMNSGESVRMWQGLVHEITFDEHTAKIKILTYMGTLIPRRIPTVTIGKACPVVLYDEACTVDEVSFTFETTVTAISGNVITVASVDGQPDQFFQFGKFKHSSSGEPMTIADQTGLIIQIKLPIPDMQVGSVVTISAGCDHTIATCGTKFDNKDNYRGMPHLPTGNVFIPNGFGVWQNA